MTLKWNFEELHCPRMSVVHLELLVVFDNQENHAEVSKDFQ